MTAPGAALLCAGAVAVLVSGCAGPAAPPEARPRASISATSSPGAVAERGRTRPSTRVHVVATGSDRRRVLDAIQDLRAVGFWRPLTRHLYYLRIGSRPGAENIPEDGHLADALFSARFDRRGSGLFCDVVIFPAAIDADLVRWAGYHAVGRLGPPPSVTDFWAAVLAHELAHCRPGRHGESAAERWEQRALEALEPAET